MSENTLEIEARLKDYISSNLDVLNKNINTFATEGAAALRKVTGAYEQQRKESAELRKEGEGFRGFVRGQVTDLKNLAIGYASVQTAVSFFKDSYKQARESQVAYQQLNAALGYNSAALKEQAQALGKQLLVEDEDIAKAQQRIANYIKDENVIKRLTPAILDLAKAKGMDLAQAADLVARSIGKDSEELGKLGIKITGTAGSMERIDSIALALNDKFGGQAKAVAELNGPMEILAFKIKEVQEGFGKLFTKMPEEEMYQQAKKNLERARNAGAFERFVGGANQAYIAALEKEVKDYEERSAKAKAKAEEDARIAAENSINAETARLREEAMKTTSAGQITLLKEQMAKEIELHKGNAQQIAYIKQIYNAQIAAARTKSPEGKDETAAQKDEQRIRVEAQKAAQDQIAKANEDAYAQWIKLKQDSVDAMRMIDENNLVQTLGSEEAGFAQRSAKMKEWHDSGLITKAYYEQGMTDIEKEQSEYRQQLAQKEKDNYERMQQGKYNAFQQVTAATIQIIKIAGNESKKAANVAKGIAIGVATVDTIVSGVKAFKAGWEAGITPYDKPVVAAAYLAGALATGGVQIAAIASQTFAKGTSSAPGGLSLVGEYGPELMDVPSGSRIYTAAETRRIVNNNSTSNNNYGGNTHNWYITDPTTGEGLRKSLRSGDLDNFVNDLKMRM